ncbi:MAG: hypothetical protein QM765_04780 [Myxococcales bacterium]
MASDEEDLRLNTLHRFQKHSPRLTLQVHSHCEVPAGCGGVVLRWVDPDAGFGAVLQVQPRDGARAWLDGTEVTTSHLNLDYGEHVLALRVVPLTVTLEAKRFLLFSGKKAGHPFACALASDAPRNPPAPPATATTQRGWRASAVAPAGWTEPGFDDRAWSELGPCRVDVAQSDSTQRWAFTTLARDAHAQLLELPDASEVFVRHRFQVARR